MAFYAVEKVLTLNPDVVLENNFLSEINKNIDKLNKNIGMMGVKILKADSERIIDSTGLVLSKFFRFFDRGSGEKDAGQYDKDLDILGPCAAAAIYRRDMLEDVKICGEYFDRYFLVMKNMEIKPGFIFYFAIYDIPRFIFLLFTNPRALGAIINAGQSLRGMLKKRKGIINAKT